jgi:16S rRNA G966 N2-methylase RsmD
VREALFSIWGERIAGARFLVLFGGSGVVSLEPRAVETLKRNLVAAGAQWIEVRRLPLPAGLARLAAQRADPFNLAFADPPYAFADLLGPPRCRCVRNKA